MTSDPLDPDQLEARLTSHGVYVTDATLDGQTIELAYESIAADESRAVPHREAGRVINVVRELLEEEVLAIESTVLDLDGEECGTWRMEADWLAALESGDLSEVEFSGKVVGTIRD